MSTESDRQVVKTYVPHSQKQRWQDHADTLEMSQSEFVRTMVQAGRRGFEGVSDESTETAAEQDSNPGGNGLEDRILDVLDREPKSFDELVAAITGDLETRVDETLQTLQEQNAITYSGRKGGYVRVDE